MDNNNVEDTISEVIEDLRAKVTDICRYAENANSNSRSKMYEIRDKAVDVLNKAANKVVDTYKSGSDINELNEVISVVMEKSKDLHYNAIRKMQAILDETRMKEEQARAQQAAEAKAKELMNDIPVLVDEKGNEFDQLIAGGNQANDGSGYRYVSDEFAYKALVTLKSWLKGEDRKV